MRWYLFIYALLLLYASSKLGIGPDEAKIIFNTQSWLGKLEESFYSFYPQEVFVRLPQIFLSLVNLWLFYRLSLCYLKPKEAFYSAFIYSLLPAVIVSGVIVNKAPFILFFTLFILLFWQKWWLVVIFSLIALLMDRSFAILFLSLTLYGIYKKDKKVILWFGALFSSSLLLYGFDVGGKPRSYFLDTFAVFAAIFSPFVFLFYFYAIYRTLIKEKKDIIWFVSAIPFLFALFLSFRQRIAIEDFAPFVVLGVIVMVRIFLRSYRVRIPKHRKKFKFLLTFLLMTLIFNDILLIFNDTLFAFIEPKRHFAYRFYLSKAIAKEVSKKSCLYIPSNSLQQQLRFYGFNCFLSKLKGKKREIFYKSYLLKSLYVTNINSSHR